ncbi:MAG: inner membrane-spanning protein YciB, partial [Caulobacteraceae bacterium]
MAEAEAKERPRERPGPVWLHWLVDAGPAVAFLIVLLVTHDFRLATWFVVVGAVVALGASLAVERRIAPLPAVSGVMAVIFGGLSIALKRADIFQMKMTIVDALLGGALFVGVAMGKNPLKLLLGSNFRLPDKAWATLAIRYGTFWWACAIANEAVRRTQTKEVWAEFRVAVI